MASSSLSDIPISITFNPDNYRTRENHIIEKSNRFVYIGGLPKEAGPTRESVLAAVRNRDLREIVQQVSAASGKTFTVCGQAANMTREKIIALLEAFLWLKDNEEPTSDALEDPDGLEALQDDDFNQIEQEIALDGGNALEDTDELIQMDSQVDVDGSEDDAEDWDLCSRTERNYEQAVERLIAVKEQTGLTLKI